MITRRFFPVAISSTVFLLASNAFGADMLPQSRIDASGTGTVPSAAPLKSGFTKATLHGESQLAPSAGEHSSYDGIDRVNRFDAVAGTSLVKGLDLHLGLHGTYEREDEEISRRVSGGSVMLKTNVINASGFNLALAPHFESGIGTKGKEKFSRAVRARGGLMMILGFNRKNAVEWNLALGNRNRASEEFADLQIGHELLYKTSLKVHVTDRLGFTLAADGRQIRSEAGPLATGRGQAGIFAKYGRFETSVYGGASIDRALGKYWKQSWKVKDLDGGKLYFGAALSMSLGSTSSRGSEDLEPARKVPGQTVPEVNPEDRNNTEGNSLNQAGAEPSYDTDFLKDYERASSTTRGDETKDDFAAAEASMKRRATEKAPVYDIESVEREIERLREADKKAEEARQKAEQARMEKERRQNAKNAAARAKQMERMRKDVQSEVDALPTITTEDMSWRGLE
ncbi:MAG: hypothetical protein RIQ81_2232 [Pseudomonadota bacterium]